MLLSALEHLETWKMSNTPLITTFTPLFPPERPFFGFWGLDWANILKLKVLAFQNVIIHASLYSETSKT